jgi:hypothetical protein
MSEEETAGDKRAFVELVDFVAVTGSCRSLSSYLVEAARDRTEVLISWVDFDTIEPSDHIWVLD